MAVQDEAPVTALFQALAKTFAAVLAPELQIFAKVLPLSEAPPTKNPSRSAFLASSPAF